jgi:hypothetical protein
MAAESVATLVINLIDDISAPARVAAATQGFNHAKRGLVENATPLAPLRRAQGYHRG